MQLSTIKVSNILSFPYIENLTTIEWVKFHNHEQGVMNIIIGPNGSGKSNLLDIIYAVRNYGITIDYTIARDDTKPLIINTNQTKHKLSKHRWQEHLSSHIYLSILLSQDDYNNIFFVLKNRDFINTIIKNHSNIDIVFPQINKEDILSFSNKIPLYLSINKDNTIELEPNNNPIISFIHLYFQNFKLIQLCIEFYNRFEKKDGPDRYPLSNTFALITSDTTIHYPNHDKGIQLLFKKLQTIEHQHGINSVFEKFFLESLNTTIHHYTHLRLNINKEQQTISFLSSEWFSFTYQELSSGEQSFLSLILLIYSHDLRNGFLIIDEPELHLHPQSQKQFLTLIEEMKTKQHMQCILATHSPTMINEHNINNVFRCSKHDGISLFSLPTTHFWEDEATLLQMLKFDHIAKIFFVDTIILVEWETDLYFFNHYLTYLSTQPQRAPHINNYEIITISGKWGVRRWQQFLRKFNINVSYIGDRDNAIEYNIITNEQIKSLPHRRFKNNKWSKYAAIVNYLKNHNNTLYNHVVESIKKLYSQHIFLLAQWDLESYIETQSKWLDETVQFCLRHFESRLASPHNDKKRKELEWIVSKIFHIRNN